MQQPGEAKLQTGQIPEMVELSREASRPGEFKIEGWGTPDQGVLQQVGTEEGKEKLVTRSASVC